MRKAKENTVGETLMFMLKTVRKEKPSVFFLFLLAFVTELIAKMSAIILPKFLIDELVLIIGGEPLENHLSRIIIYAALIVGIALSTNLLLNLEAQLMSVRSEWFNKYFETEL